ncbi:MAG TPA: MBL fold metallo-hydrolase [Terriglobales bacterium]|nr:MBL fold metallo-hydrolase [Terriglobales bacterium]
MRLQLVRHATLTVEYNGQTILVDPMLDDAGARPAIENSPNPRQNPLVALPVPAAEVVKGVSAVLVTHTHSDHWDSTAAQILAKNLPLFCQPQDEQKFRDLGFGGAQVVTDSLHWRGIEIRRTGGQHGTGDIGKAMAPVSGFVLLAAEKPTLYIAGDTIWCEEVQQTLRQHRPKIVVVNTGGARFLEGDPITMSADDVIRTCQAAPDSQIVAVHMEAINHCLLTRADLAFQLEAARVIQQVAIPGDGDWVQTGG